MPRVRRAAVSEQTLDHFGCLRLQLVSDFHLQELE
jgi:hypothetical protein